MGPGDLEDVLAGMTSQPDKRLLVGLETRDDAGVFQISEDVALVQTVDFFTPIVDDPFEYGRIAAANSLSDAYAMGAKPVTALNIVGFPLGDLDKSILGELLRGGWDKAQEAGVTIVGGHSVKDPEMKFGMAVTATVHPERIVRNCTGKVGDQLILTKPLGTGILTTALKQERLSDTLLAQVTQVMGQLNRVASEVMLAHQASACTDVTGFGFLGHLYEMTMESPKTAVVFSKSIPCLPQALEWSAEGKVPGGLRTNRRYLERFFSKEDAVSEAMVDLLCDPQTSGGLLFSVPSGELLACLQALKECGLEAAHVGEFVGKEEKPLRIM